MPLHSKGESDNGRLHLVFSYAFTRYLLIHRCFSYKVKRVELINQKFMVYLCKSVIENKISFISVHGHEFFNPITKAPFQ